MNIPLTSNATEVLHQVQSLPARMAIAIAAAMNLENQLTVGHIQADYLTGPRPLRLGVRTNRLRSSINASPARIEGDTITSAIGTNVKYAGVHEHGFEGDVTVRSHTREISGRKGVGGRLVQDNAPVFSSKTGKITRYKKAKQRTVIGETTVRSFTRHMKMPARPFLAPGIADREADYGRAISTAILTAWNSGNPIGGAS